MLKLRNTGRGRGYTPRKALTETCKQLLFWGDWPRRLARHLPGATAVHCERRTLDLLPPPRTASTTPASPRRPLRLALATDLHLGACTHAETLEHAAALLRAAQPDLLLLGGDYVYHDASPERAARLAAWVSSIPATLKVAVWGNHDLWTTHGQLEQALTAVGVRWLVNEALRLPPPWNDVALLGLDDAFAGQPNPEDALRAARQLDAKLLLALCHDSDHARTLAAGGVALQLCGHTHGGQIALPGGRPLVTVGRHGRRFSAGWFDLAPPSRPAATAAPRWLYVSRGVGAVGLPLRVFAPADVAVLTLREAPRPPGRKSA